MADKNKETIDKPVVVAKNAAELQKIRLQKLMNNPTKPVHIPDKSKDYKPRDPLEFIRNIWGSSAGAGSGDFHVYRGVRRREYARQKFRKERDEKEEADDAYHEKVGINQKTADERTSKKRAKRLKKKQKQKNKKPRKEECESSDDDDDDDEVGSNDHNDGSERIDMPGVDRNSSSTAEMDRGNGKERTRGSDESTSETDRKSDSEKGGSGSEQSGSNTDR